MLSSSLPPEETEILMNSFLFVLKCYYLHGGFILHSLKRNGTISIHIQALLMENGPAYPIVGQAAQHKFPVDSWPKAVNYSLLFSHTAKLVLHIHSYFTLKHKSISSRVSTLFPFLPLCLLWSPGTGMFCEMVKCKYTLHACHFDVVEC